MRAVHDLGPEIRRAISGNLGEEEFPDKDIEEPMHRVCICVISRFKTKKLNLQKEKLSHSCKAKGSGLILIVVISAENDQIR